MLDKSAKLTYHLSLSTDFTGFQMAMSTQIEKIETGDSIVVWIEDGPKRVVVKDIEEGVTVHTLQVSCEGAPFELAVPRGHTVVLAC